MALVCVGYDIDLILASGETYRVASSVAALYDQTGVDWPKTSVLFRPFERSDHPVEKKRDRFARDWFGKNYDLRAGSVTLPPRELSQGWHEEIGDVAQIFYSRGSGDDRPAKYEGDYEHAFTERNLFDVFSFRKKHLPKLFRLANAMRLEIGRRYVVTARGFENA